MTTASLIARAHDEAVDDDLTRPPGLGGERSPPSTRPGSSTSTTRCAAGSTERGACCAGRACTPRTSPSGARPATPAPATAWPRRPKAAPLGRAGRAGEAAPPQRAARGRAGPHEAWRWRSREKRTRSWSCSPRARTPSRSRSRDRRALRRPGSGDLDEARRARCWARRGPPTTGAGGHRCSARRRRGPRRRTR